MTDKERQPLKADPKRQANDPLRGYRYQILHSVNAWLDLADNEVLYLEGAEDFDIASDDAGTAVQVKDTQHNITLRSQEVIDAINNYWELRANNPDRRVKFRFLTRSKIGTEQENPFRSGKPGLQVWSRCSGDDQSIKKIFEFLLAEGKISEEVKEFLQQEQTNPQKIYEQLIEPITWETGSKEASFVEKSISEKLVRHGDRYPIPIPPPDAKKVADHLLREALMVATQTENRELTKTRFVEIFWEKTSQSVPVGYLQRLQTQATQTNILDTANAKFIGGSTDISIQSHSSILNTIPPLFPDVLPRTDLITSIRASLESEGMVVIHGGAGRGKTTLAKLTAKSIIGSWFWMSFTNRESSQVLQNLHHLAFEIGNQSSPVNIVLDDLNLQPQQLQGYEEILGVVVYGAIERGATVLITSQHKLPDYFIRHLGASPSVVIPVSDFTLPEIEQFAVILGCPDERVKTSAKLVELHTSGHPRLVHARLARLNEENWKRPDTIEDIVQTPDDVVDERETARQLLSELPENQREFLYRLSLMPIEFRRDYALNIGEIPESIPMAGDTFSQLVGPWIDRVTETYYKISPLLTKAAEQVWSEGKTKILHAQIANAILKTRNLTPIEAWSVLTHSMAGQNKVAFIAIVGALITGPEENWKELSHEFSLLIHIKTKRLQELFLGDPVVNILFRSLQHRVAVEIDPEAATRILENWDKETVPYEPHQLYLLDRVMLAEQALFHGHATLSAKKIIDYFKEIIEITIKHKQFQAMYSDSTGKFKGYNTDKSNYFSALFSYCYRAPNPNLCPLFLSDLVDALDGLQPEIRRILLADFEDDSVDCRLLIDGVWLAESKLDNPNWTGCLEVFDKVIDKTVAWGYLHLAAASARGKAIIHDEYLYDPDTAHKVLQDIESEVGRLPVIEEEQANVYFGQRNYREALKIYERILPVWNPPSEQLNLGPLEEYRRAAICAAELNDWGKAATFFKRVAKRTLEIERSERYIGLYADAGFANFKAGNYCESVKQLILALQGFEKLPQDNTDVKYYTLKKRLAYSIGWIAKQERDYYNAQSEEPQVALCSNSETDEKVLNLPDSPIEYIWLSLAQIEYKFGNDTTVLNRARGIPDRDSDPAFSFNLSALQTQYDFRNKTLDNLPQRIHQLANACETMREQYQSGKRIRAKGVDSSSIAALANFASIESVTALFVSALLIPISIGEDTREIIAIWRKNSSEPPVKNNVLSALNLVESMLSRNQNSALTALTKQDVKYEERLAAALKIVDCGKTSPEGLFRAHTLIATALVDRTWVDSVVTNLAELLSKQWLEKIKFRSMLITPMITVPEIEKVCNSSEAGKKKIGKILLAAREAISLEVASEYLQRFRSWAELESEQKPDAKSAKNPIAQRLIRAMEKPPRLTHEDIEVLRQSIEEGKIPETFDSPFGPDKDEHP